MQMNQIKPKSNPNEIKLIYYLSQLWVYPDMFNHTHSKWLGKFVASMDLVCERLV